MDKAKLIELVNEWEEAFRSAHTTYPEHVERKVAKGADEQLHAQSLANNPSESGNTERQEVTDASEDGHG